MTKIVNLQLLYSPTLAIESLSMDRAEFIGIMRLEYADCSHTQIATVAYYNNKTFTNTQLIKLYTVYNHINKHQTYFVIIVIFNIFLIKCHPDFAPNKMAAF